MFFNLHKHNFFILQVRKWRPRKVVISSLQNSDQVPFSMLWCISVGEQTFYPLNNMKTLILAIKTHKKI